MVEKLLGSKQTDQRRTFQIDNERVGTVVISEQSQARGHLDASTPIAPGTLEVRKGEEIVHKEPIPDASFAIFEIHPEDIEVKDLIRKVS